MAKKTKDLELNSEETTVSTTSNKNKIAKSTKKETAKKASSSQTSKSTTTSSKTTTAKKSTKTVAKKSSAAKKASTEKSTTKKATATKKETTKKASTKKTTSAKKTSTRKKATTTRSKKVLATYKSEYYDLPLMYNKTVVKVLAQTPKMLFIYWEISESDKKKLKKMYGENFFEVTRPVLIVYNDTLRYSFEVEINDFANSWYLSINDANCDYHIELGRRPYPNAQQNNIISTLSPMLSQDEPTQPIYIPYYIYLTSSNNMTAPNNRILFDSSLQSIKFRNVKTGQTSYKDIRQFTFITNYGIFSVKDLYRFLYPNENFEFENIFIGNPSSGGLTSSGMFSSQFK